MPFTKLDQDAARRGLTTEPLLRATLFDQPLAGLDEQAGETEKGAGWPPGM